MNENSSLSSESKYNNCSKESIFIYTVLLCNIFSIIKALWYYPGIWYYYTIYI